MKIIIPFLLTFLLSTPLSAKGYPVIGYFNHTMNLSSMKQGITINVPANIGDSITLIAYFYQLGAHTPGPWYFNGNSFPGNGLESITLIAQSYGIFSSQISICLAQLTLVPPNPTGINQTVTSSIIKVYPTLTKAKLYVDLELPVNENIAIIVYSAEGRQVKSTAYKNILGEFKTEIDFEELTNGIYFITVNIGNNSVKKKIIKI